MVTIKLYCVNGFGTVKQNVDIYLFYENDSVIIIDMTNLYSRRIEVETVISYLKLGLNQRVLFFVNGVTISFC